MNRHDGVIAMAGGGSKFRGQWDNEATAKSRPSYAATGYARLLRSQHRHRILTAGETSGKKASRTCGGGHQHDNCSLSRIASAVLVPMGAPVFLSAVHMRLR